MSRTGEAAYPAAGRRVRRAMRRERRKRAQRRTAIFLLVVLGLAFGVVAYLAAEGSDRSREGAAPARPLALVAGGEVLAKIDPERAERLGTGTGELPLDARRVLDREGVERTLEVDEALLRRRLAAAAVEGGVVTVPERPVASRIDAPIVRQVFRNNCETAALSMLLATAGVDQDQRTLQEEIAKAAPLDPEAGPGGETVWGDPDEGFVGRVDGGGPAGGFGVLQGPVAELAARWVDPVDLSGRDPGALYQRLLAGHAVMAWIGLSDGPYETWRSPEGRDVTVNFGEHTVVLTGIEGDRLFVNDPLDGRRKVWTKDEFESMWKLLDRRALSL